MDTIFINNLKVITQIGIHPFEEKIKQQLVINLEIARQDNSDRTSDQLEQTLDYEAIANCILQFCEHHPYKLLEALGEALAQALLSTFQSQWIRLELCKQTVAIPAETVGIRIERGHLPA